MLGKHGTSSIKCSDKPPKDRKVITLETKLVVLSIGGAGEEGAPQHSYISLLV